MSVQVNIDLGAFERNVATLVNRVTPASVWIALKSHAYGHGMIELADNALRAGASGLAVLDIPAAVALRNHGVSATLFAWLHGNETDFDLAVSHSIDIGVSTISQLEAAAQAGARIGAPARVHLKIDTGLHRNGFAESDWLSACESAAQHEVNGLISVVGIWSHLADASVEADRAALTRFDSAVATAIGAGLNPSVRHIAASSAGFTNADARYDIVRFGILAYGVSPFDAHNGTELGLSPIMSVSSTATTLDDGKVAVGAGWYDGIPQNPRGAWVLLDGQRCAVVAVHARFTIIDVHSSFGEGATVAVIGNGGPSAEDWAAWTNTIGDEIVTGIPSTARRVFS